nr:hypothetical protein [Enterobacter sp. T1-1]
MASCQSYRAKKPKSGEQSPQFKMCIDLALKERLDTVAAEEGVSLASWLKELARKAFLKKKYYSERLTKLSVMLYNEF